MGATILIPTRGRPQYLETALASVAPQASDAGAEILVIDDGVDPATAVIAARHGARMLHGGRRGANAARNLGIAASRGDPVILVDDDVRAPQGWLAALLAGVADPAGGEVAGGPIIAALEDGGPSSCGREASAITTLDLGARDRDADLVWSANMAIRRSALVRIGPFDESILGRGEEEEWERRFAAAGGRIRYVAAAGLEHRRVGADARLPALARAAYSLGRTARRFDQRKDTLPSLSAELRTLVGCAGHAIRYGCPNMLTGVAHSLGRLREALAERGA